MFLLIDGYNLLYASDIFPAAGPATFQRARAALLDDIAVLLTAAQRERTTIVFDAQQAPPGLPQSMRWRRMAVRFAPRHGEADDEIERLINQHSAPRQLVVVSSDHRVQRAARRRKALAIDSDVWLHQQRRIAARQSATDQHAPADDDDATPAELTELNARDWLDFFGIPEE